VAAPTILKNSALEASTALAADLMDQIQGLVNSLWVIDYDIPGGAGTLSGSPNNLSYNYSATYQDSGTIIPGVPAYTVTPAYTVPAVVSPAVPGWGTTNICGPWSSCTTEVPGTPAFTVTPAYVVPAVVSPAIPATTGGYSTELNISATAQGISDSLNPLFSSVTFTSGVMTAPNSNGLATETVTYNLNQEIQGSAIRITGRAAFDNLSVTIAGLTTNFGDISTGTLSLSPVPNVPIYFDAIVEIPSFNSTPDRTANGVAYELFPQTTGVSVDNLSISTGVTAVADFINDDLLSYLTDFWNYSVVPLYTAVGATAPEAPSQTLANTISKEADSVQSEVNSQAESGLNSLLKQQLPTIQPYVQALTAAVWDYQDYPIFPGGNYSSAILVSGLFSGVDASNSSFENANCSNSDFSNANLTGSNFSGANLTGVNFSGAIGAPSASLASASIEPEDVSTTSARPGLFSNSVIFGADFTNSSLDPSGAFYDSNTSFATGYSPKANGLQYFSAAQFVAGYKPLIKAFGSEISSATGAFINDRSACGCPNKTGLRSDVITGKLLLDNFNEKAYFSSLSNGKQAKLDALLEANPDLNRDDTIAMYKIANSESWSDGLSQSYIFSNSDLIDQFGGSRKALNNARKHYINKGFFEERLLNNDSLYSAYVDAYPAALFDSGATVLDQSSLAQHFVTKGYSEGQRIPTTLG
jgi:hypothetical protein